jgi:hypothetical protein
VRILKESSIKQRFARVWFMFLCALTVINLFGISTNALTGGIAIYADDNVGDGANDDSNYGKATISPSGSYTYEEFIQEFGSGGYFNFPETYTSLASQASGDSTTNGLSLLYANFKNSNEYMSWLNKAKAAMANDGNATSLGMEPVDIGNYDADSQEYANRWAKYNSAVAKFNSIMTRNAYNNLTEDVFGRDFNPTNAITLAFQDSFASACNTIFNIAAQALMLLFLVQTAFDVLYLVIPALQPILGSANSSSAPGGGSAGVAKGGSFKLQFNLVSNEAIDAANRSSTGTTGGAGSGNITETVTALKYIINRAPTFILAASYIVLAVTGIWPKIISAVSAFVAQIFNALI